MKIYDVYSDRERVSGGGGERIQSPVAGAIRKLFAL